MENIFDRDFYPTPKKVIDLMMLSTPVVGKIVLEPSAGSGNIVDWLKENGAKEVIACEANSKLRAILSTKCTVVSDDFLKLNPEDVSHVDIIVMNPPFSADEHHILHAFDIAPAGCEIIALCNYNTIENYRHIENRKRLREIIEANGNSEDFGQCFVNDAERSTDVRIACVRLFKPGSGKNEFEGYFSTQEDTDHDNGENGIMSYNFVRDIVNRYVEAVKRFDGVMNAAQEINDLTSPFNRYGIEFGAFKTSSSDNVPSKITREYYKKYLQKKAWRYIFSEMDMKKYVTTKVGEKINQFVEKQEHVPFTMRNVYLMLELIVGTHGNRMRDTLIEAFDQICSYSAENSTAGEKWKTNSDYMINRRFIIPHICEGERWGAKNGSVTLSRYRHNEIDDIIKALCYVTGTNYNDCTTLYNFIETMDLEWGKWHNWGFFRIRGYKKGTMHFEFADESVWQTFNIEVAKIKGWRLPKQRTKKI